jgi:hypothetical protein
MHAQLTRSFVFALAAAAALLTGTAAQSGGKSAPDPAGEPKGFKAGESMRYALWIHKDVWHLRTTTAKKLHNFKGKITVEGGTIDFIQSVNLEEKGKYEDFWVLSPNHQELKFDFKTDRGIDGINFEVSKDAKLIHFNLHIDGKHHADRIFIGRGNHHPGSDPFDLAAH